MSSSLWDWAVILAGIRPAEGLFVPFYWAVPSWPLLHTGYLPSPALVLSALILLSLITAGIFFWKRKWIWLDISCIIWGAIMADTPYVFVVPLLVWFAWTQLVRFARWTTKKDLTSYIGVPWIRFACVSAFAFFSIVAVNFVRFNVEYPAGYFRNAWAALHLAQDGAFHPFECAKMDKILNCYVAELAKEGEGCKWIFTDGLCDSGVELVSRGELRTVSLAGGTEGREAWKLRGFKQWEDLSALEGGSCGLLRAWAVDRPENLTNAVFQCAFAFLEREAPGKTTSCGLVMRPGKPDKAESDRAWAAVNDIAQQIVDFYENGGDGTVGGRLRTARFCAMQWRVARALRRHAMQLDREKRIEDALAQTAFSEKLDMLNPFAKKLDAATETADLRTFGSVTPREGLSFALRRANFSLARQFALPILKDDPKHVEANFAMAMSHLITKEYSQARRYFEAAVAVRPNDATLLNNLALTLLQLGEVELALAKAEAALKLKPDSIAIKDTLRQIRQWGKKTER